MNISIREQIRKNIEDFLITSLQDLIDKKDYNMWKLTNIYYGKYLIHLTETDIRVKSRETTFTFDYIESKSKYKTFFGYKFFERKIKSKSKIGIMKDKIEKLFNIERELEQHKDMIDSLPEKEKKKILRTVKMVNLYNGKNNKK